MTTKDLEPKKSTRSSSGGMGLLVLAFIVIVILLWLANRYLGSSELWYSA